MADMTRLLNKPLKTFIAFTCVVLACSIPAYFYLVESIWLEELDDHNLHLKEQVVQRFNETDGGDLDKKISLWNEIQFSSRISPAAAMRADSLYIVEREIMEQGRMELERFRGLRSAVALHGRPYTITIETNVEEVHETVLAISVVTCLFIALLIGGFILLNRRISRSIWMPFTQTLDQLKRFDLDSGTALTFEKTDILEFSELNQALQKLIDNNIQTYRQQKEFAQNASHELQTPLALLKTKLDLLIQDAGLSTGQRKIIESLDSSVSRVTRINKNLLLLAGIENRPYDSAEIDLSALVRSLAGNFTEFAAGKHSAISMSIQNGVTVRANESLVEILVSNLLSNTLRHGLSGSGITVTLTTEALIISNEGNAALIENRLFQRFI